MNKQIGIVIVVVLLLLLGGGAFVMMHKSSPTPAAQTAETSPTQTTAPAQTMGTLKNLLTSGKPQTCTFTSQNGNTTGTVYTANGKMAGDFTINTKGNTITSHMIVDARYTYVWTGMTKMGIKIAISDTPTPSVTPADNQGLGLNETVSYSCSDWTVDASKFTIPTDIKFSTFTIPSAAVPTGTGASGTNAATSQCSVCDSLPAAAQSACKTQLHCQ